MKVSLSQIALLLPLCICLVGCQQRSEAPQIAVQEGPPAVLIPGLGTLHHAIATSNPEAQKFFDQGLTLVYAFNFAEAARSFRQATRLDPRAAMPYWGIALALGPNYNGVYHSEREKPSFDAIQYAKKLSAHGPENERAYIEALAQRFSNDPAPDLGSLAHNYADAMRKVSARYPDDPDASVLYAESLMDLHPYHHWKPDGQPGEDTLETQSTLERVLTRWPDHPGANHFYIHLMDTSPHPELALTSAKRLETLAPAAGHLLHMPAHVYLRTGDYSAAVRAALSAAAADREYVAHRTMDDMPYVMGYAYHNYLFLIYAGDMDGEFEIALKSADELAAVARSDPSDWPSAEEYTVPSLFVLLRHAKWIAILAVAQPDSQSIGQTFFWHYARGCAFAQSGRLREADTERQAMEQTYQQIPQGRFGMLFNSWSAAHDVALATLNARIATAQHNQPGAIDQWRAAVAVQDQMDFREIPAWYYPVRESLGAALLRAGNASGAEKTFRDDLVHNPENPRSYFGLWKSLEAEGKASDAKQAQLQFEAAWKGNPRALRIVDF